MKRKAPFGLFIKENPEDEEISPTKSKKRARRLSDRQILKELSRILSVSENDIPKALERFKKEIEEIEKGIL